MKFLHIKLRLSSHLSHGFFILSLLLLASCSSEPENPVDAIYFGGDILTMAGDQPQYVEAMTIDDGKVSFLGTKLEADKLVGKETKQINLQGAALIPAVVSGVQQILTLQGVSNEPNCWKDSNFKTTSELMAALKTAQAERAKLGLGVFCLGYVPNVNAVLTEADLDAAFPETSVILVDASLQNVLTNSVAKKKFTLDSYKMLKKAVQKTGQQSVGLQVGQAADFMIIDKNPLEDTSISLASINITGTYINGQPAVDSPKNLGMLAILDIFSAYSDEKAAATKLEEVNAAALAEQEKQKKADQEKLKRDAEATAKSKAKATTKKSVSNTKGNRVEKEVSIAPPAESVKTEPTTKPKTARFNMTQDGKKMTAEDFDAWMKAQGIRIVPASPAATTPPKVDEKK